MKDLEEKARQGMYWSMVIGALQWCAQKDKLCSRSCCGGCGGWRWLEVLVCGERRREEERRGEQRRAEESRAEKKR